MAVRHLIVTGATGYIGARVVELAMAEGRSVTALGRRPAALATHHTPWTLGEPLPHAALRPEAEQALVHLAHDWNGASADAFARNVEGSKTLFESAAAQGVARRAFVSSQSARADALNSYGRMKHAVEQALEGAVSLRVGLVYGGPRTAMYGLLCRLTQLPVLPMVDPHRGVQPIHRDEVARGILAAIDLGMTGACALAGPDPIPFGDVLTLLARAYEGRRLRILPVPLRLALAMCDATSAVPLLPTVDRERVLGLAGTRPIPARDDLAALGVTVRPMAEMLAAEPAGRRALLAEGEAFLRYAIGARTTPAILKRYARAFPDGAIARPRWLRLTEPVFSTNALATRLRIAARLGEASLTGERRLSGGSRGTRLATLALGLTGDALTLPFRLLTGAGK